MSKQLKTLERTVALECYTNRVGKRILSEIESAYRKMLTEMIDFALKMIPLRKFFIAHFTKNTAKSSLG